MGFRSFFLYSRKKDKRVEKRKKKEKKKRKESSWVRDYSRLIDLLFGLNDLLKVCAENLFNCCVSFLLLGIVRNCSLFVFYLPVSVTFCSIR